MKPAETDSLFGQWRARLTACEAVLQADANGALAWRARIERKILRFLLARYPGNEAGRGAANFPTFVSPLAFIASPKARPIPRERKSLLRRVARENAEARNAPVSMWEQLCIDDAHRNEAWAEKERVRKQREAAFRERLRERQREFARRARERNKAGR